MRLSLLGLCLISLPLFAADPISFKNDREGKSIYQTNANNRVMNRALKTVDKNEILGAFEDALEGQVAGKLCAYDVNESFLKNLKARNNKFKEFAGAVYLLRSEEEIDDVTASILLRANEISTAAVLPKDTRKLVRVSGALAKDGLPLIAKFETEYDKNLCFDEAYRRLINDLMKIDKTLSNNQIEVLLLNAIDSKKISENTYLKLERARAEGIQSSNLSLKDYYQKLTSIRNQYPLRDPSEKSNYITEKAEKQKVSHRQRLYENYTDIQIMVMAGVVKSLRARLESPKVEILIYNRQNIANETITLEPMERFRLAIKLLRKEMSYLALSSTFEGRSPSYLDIMASAYEIGIIPAEEVDELAGLQDLWNPKKTLWEKAKVWVQTMSTVATVVIPPPYGFIPALAIVVIEATTEKSYSANENDPTSLF